MYLAEPPRITIHPKELKDTVHGKPILFTVKATGTEPLTYQWQWKPIRKEDGSDHEEWQNLSCGGLVRGTDTPTLKFSTSSEGLYRCVVTNPAGEVQSKSTMKHDDMKMLQNDMERLTRSYESERENVSELVQKTVALMSDLEELKVYFFHLLNMMPLHNELLCLGSLSNN